MQPRGTSRGPRPQSLRRAVHLPCPAVGAPPPDRLFQRDCTHPQLARGLEAFRHALRERGWMEGHNLAIEYRFAEGRFERLPTLAAELVGLHVDVIVTEGSEGVQAAQHATQTIPIVMRSVGDPVQRGFIASLARPGGNITGLAVT